MKRAFSITGVLTSLALLAAQPALAQTDPKSASGSGDARRFFDLDEPDPSEILPNPPRGAGNAPRLFLFGPVGRVGAPSGNYGTQDINGRYSEVGGSGGDGPPSPNATRPPQTPPAPATPPRVAEPPTPPTPRAETNPLSDQERAERAMRNDLARDIERSTVEFHPSEQAERDVQAFQAEERRYQQLATQLADQIDARAAATAAPTPGNAEGSSNPNNARNALTPREQRRTQQTIRNTIAKQIASNGTVPGYQPSARASRNVRVREAEKAIWRATANNISTSLRQSAQPGRTSVAGNGRGNSRYGNSARSGGKMRVGSARRGRGSGGRYGGGYGTGRSRYGVRYGNGIPGNNMPGAPGTPGMPGIPGGDTSIANGATPGSQGADPTASPGNTSSDSSGSSNSGSDQAGMGGTGGTGMMPGAGMGMGLGMGMGMGMGMSMGGGGMPGISAGRMAPAPRPPSAPSAPPAIQNSAPGRIAMNSAPGSMTGSAPLRPAPAAPPIGAPRNSAPSFQPQSNPGGQSANRPSAPSASLSPQTNNGMKPAVMPPGQQAGTLPPPPSAAGPSAPSANTNMKPAVVPPNTPPAGSPGSGAVSRPTTNAGAPPSPNLPRSQVFNPYRNTGADTAQPGQQTARPMPPIQNSAPGKIAMNNAPTSMSGAAPVRPSASQGNLAPQSSNQRYPTAPPEGCWAEARNCTPGQTYILDQTNTQCPQGRCAFVYQPGPNGHGATWTLVRPGANGGGTNGSVPGSGSVSGSGAGGGARIAQGGGGSSNTMQIPPTLPWLQNGWNPLLDGKSPTGGSGGTQADGSSGGSGRSSWTDTTVPGTLPWLHDGWNPLFGDMPPADLNNGPGPLGSDSASNNSGDLASNNSGGLSSSFSNDSGGSSAGAPSAGGDSNSSGGSGSSQDFANSGGTLNDGSSPNSSISGRNTASWQGSNPAGGGSSPQSGDAYRDPPGASVTDSQSPRGSRANNAPSYQGRDEASLADLADKTRQIRDHAMQRASDAWNSPQASEIRSNVAGQIQDQIWEDVGDRYAGAVENAENLPDLGRRLGHTPFEAADDLKGWARETKARDIITKGVTGHLDSTMHQANQEGLGRIINNNVGRGDKETKDLSDTVAGFFYNTKSTVLQKIEAAKAALERFKERNSPYDMIEKFKIKPE